MENMMNKHAAESFLTGEYNRWVRTKKSEGFRVALVHVLINLDIETVEEILSNFDLTGLDHVIEEAHKCVAEELSFQMFMEANMRDTMITRNY
jgi:uncharacterized protein YutE (UPF0331/DUF86 family)